MHDRIPTAQPRSEDAIGPTADRLLKAVLELDRKFGPIESQIRPVPEADSGPKCAASGILPTLSQVEAMLAQCHNRIDSLHRSIAG